MNRDNLATIEQRLGLALPQAYSQMLLAGVAIAGLDIYPYLQQDPNELLIENLELRMCPVVNAFCGAAWPDNYVCVGNDGCGNYYCISTDDPKCAVQFFDHEADAFNRITDNLADYIKYVSDLLNRVSKIRASDNSAASKEVRAFPLSPDAVVTRADKPRESVLNPISMQEWTAFVTSDAELEMRGFRSAVNPFTNEERRSDCPGLAIMVSQSKPSEFEYAFGRIIVRRPGQAALSKLDQIARALNAKVITGW